MVTVLAPPMYLFVEKLSGKNIDARGRTMQCANTYLLSTRCRRCELIGLFTSNAWRERGTPGPQQAFHARPPPLYRCRSYVLGPTTCILPLLASRKCSPRRRWGGGPQHTERSFRPHPATLSLPFPCLIAPGGQVDLPFGGRAACVTSALHRWFGLAP